MGVGRPNSLVAHNARRGSGLTTACTRLCSSLRSARQRVMLTVGRLVGIKLKEALTDFMETIEKLIQRGQQTPHGFKDIQNAADDVVASNTIEDWVG